MINTTESEISIQLSPSELRWCQNHAEEIVEYYGGHGTKGSGTYNHNKISSNLVGVKSEVATCRWLKERDLKIRIEENFKLYKEKRLKGDIQARGKVIEVKGLRPHQWDKFKRMIPPRQLHYCVRNKSIVIWTTTKGNCKNPEVILKGWNYAWEVKEYGEEIRTICDNIWLREDEKMRSMETLAAEIMSNTPINAPKSPQLL